MRQEAKTKMATQSDIVEIAKNEIGTKETPRGSNNVKYNTSYYGKPVSGDSYPWCMAFVWWVFKEAGASDLLFNVKTAYCPTLYNEFKKRGQLFRNGYESGDVVFFDWNGNGSAEHIGIIESVNDDGSVYTIEGNTSDGNDSNGGEVMRRKRKNGILAVGRPLYAEEEEMTYEQFCEYMDRYLRVEGTGDNPSPWARDKTEWAKEKGIFNGNGLGDYGWQKPITREAAAVVLKNLSGE